MFTEKGIRKLLLDMNKNKADGLVITRPLSDKVDYAKFWPENVVSNPQSDKGIAIEPLTGYLIRGEDSQYIAVVLIGEGLKWYVMPQYRKGNAFLTPFKEMVIPHLLQHKPIQRLIINRAEYGEKEINYLKKTALSAGFKITRNNGSEIKMAVEAAFMKKREYISGKDTGISEQRKQEIEKEVSCFIQKLKVFETEIALKTGDLGYAEDIKEAIEVLEMIKAR